MVQSNLEVAHIVHTTCDSDYYRKPDSLRYEFPRVVSEGATSTVAPHFEFGEDGKVDLILPPIPKTVYIAWQNPGMALAYELYGRNGILFDATHHISGYVVASTRPKRQMTHSPIPHAPSSPSARQLYYLVTFMVMDVSGCAIPVLCVVCSDTTKRSLHMVLACLIHLGRGIVPEWIMTDGGIAEAEAISAAFCMGEPGAPKYFFCAHGMC